MSLEIFSSLVVNGLGEDCYWRELVFEDTFKRKRWERLEHIQMLRVRGQARGRG